jgi:hypothetical protein
MRMIGIVSATDSDLGGLREQYAEGRSAALGGLHLDVAVVQLNDPVHHRQANTCPMILRREIQIKDLREMFLGNADAGVLHPNLDALMRHRPARDAQRAALRHGLTGIDSPGEQSIVTFTPFFFASGSTIGWMAPNSSGTRTGASRRSSGLVNLRNPCTTPSSRRISLSMISTCSRALWAAGGRAGTTGPPLDSPNVPVPAAATGCGWVAWAKFRIFVRRSSRWMIIAFSGFFTSCAMPAVSRPSATSFREYASIDCTRDM